MVSAAVSSSSEAMMPCRSSGESSSMMSARSAGWSAASLSLERRSFTRRSGSGFDQVHEFPADFARRQLCLDSANGHRRDDALQQAAHGAGKADVHLGDAQFGVAVGALIGEVDVVHAHYFAAVGVDDLLVEQVFADGEPRFIGLVEFERGFVGGEAMRPGATEAI